MSKINWVDGSFLTPSLQNAYWGTGADSGHQHNGLDVDGSVPQIDLAVDVDGILPAAKVAAIDIESGTTGQLAVGRVTSAVTTDTLQNITGAKTFLSTDTTSSYVNLKNAASNTTLTIKNNYLGTFGAGARSMAIYGSSGTGTSLGVDYLVDWAGLSSTTVSLADLGLGSDLQGKNTIMHFDLTFVGWTGAGFPADVYMHRFDYVNSLFNLIAAGTTARAWAYPFTYASAIPTMARYATASPGAPMISLMYNASLAPNGFYFLYTPVSGTLSWSLHGRISKQYISASP